MRVWKSEASRTEDRRPSKWGYVLAASEEEALDMCKQTSDLPFNWVHMKSDRMLWPGTPGERVNWSE